MSKTLYEAMALDLSFDFDGREVVIPGAGVRSCFVQAENFGYFLKIDFVVSNEFQDDPVFNFFISDGVIGVSLTLTTATPSSDEEYFSMTLFGYVTQRILREQTYEGAQGKPVLLRYYQVEILDPARFFWQQHFPCELYVESSMKDVIETQLLPEITLTMDSTCLSKIEPLICVATGGNISFYDYLVDYCYQHNCQLIFDYAESTYKLLDELPQDDVQSAFLPHQIAQLSFHWPTLDRASKQILNGTAASSSQMNLDCPHAYDGVRRDILVRKSISAQLDTFKEREEKDCRPKSAQMALRLNQWPRQTCWPGALITIDGDVAGNQVFGVDAEYCIHSLMIKLAVDNEFANENARSGEGLYSMQLDIKGYKATTEQHWLPENKLSVFPIFVEGIVVNPLDEEEETTYDISSNDDTGLQEYSVFIPLWNITIKILFFADFFASHFYFPLYRDTQVLIRLEQYRGYIERVLNWGEGVALPNETQGNHLHMGKGVTDRTHILHYYQDRLPVFSIERNKESDTQLFRMEEGCLILQTNEED